MAKAMWKAGTFEYPIPAVMVSCGDMEKSNIITVAWTGILSSDPATVYISVRPSRYSYEIIKETKEFVINLTNEKLAYATDWCGVKTGAKVDKFKEMRLEKAEAEKIHAPMILNSPVNIECKVTECKELGSHHMFLATVEAVHIDEDYLNEKGKFCLNDTGLVTYSHGEYFLLGKKVGSFGYSVQKKKKKKRKK